MDSKGKLLVTTKNSMARNIFGWVVGIICLVLGFFIMFNDAMSRITQEMGWDFFGSLRAGVIIQVVLMILLLCAAFGCFAATWSYCEVYEHAVKGTTRLGLTKGMRKFELPYRDIVNATVSGKTIKIHTVAGAYEAMAASNRMEAMQTIQERIAQIKQSPRN